VQLVFLALMVLLWGLRESNQVDHLKVSVMRSHMAVL